MCNKDGKDLNITEFPSELKYYIIRKTNIVKESFISYA